MPRPAGKHGRPAPPCAGYFTISIGENQNAKITGTEINTLNFEGGNTVVISGIVETVEANSFCKILVTDEGDVSRIKLKGYSSIVVKGKVKSVGTAKFCDIVVKNEVENILAASYNDIRIENKSSICLLEIRDSCDTFSVSDVSFVDEIVNSDSIHHQKTHIGPLESEIRREIASSDV